MGILDKYLDKLKSKAHKFEMERARKRNVKKYGSEMSYDQHVSKMNTEAAKREKEKADDFDSDNDRLKQNYRKNFHKQENFRDHEEEEPGQEERVSMYKSFKKRG